MELVLAIDNLVFIAILINELPESQRNAARRIGIGLAVTLGLMLLGRRRSASGQQWARS